MTLPEAERRLRASIAGHESWAGTDDRTKRTEPARRAFLLKFEEQVDPEHKLDPAERAMRAESARKAYYKRLALKSAKARRLKREAREAAARNDRLAS